MKKKFVASAAIICLVLVTTFAKAQLPKALVFGNFTVANPQGDFKNSYANGNGFEIGGGLGLGKILLTASTGIINYNPQVAAAGNYKVVPVKAGARVYLIGKLFVNAQAGIAFQSFEKSNITGNTFLYELGTGVKVLHLIEIGAAYTSFKSAGVSGITNNALLLKAGFSIKL